MNASVAALPDMAASPPPVVQPEPTPGITVGGVISKPITWFCVAGWGLALLLLFRRRSI